MVRQKATAEGIRRELGWAPEKEVYTSSLVNYATAPIGAKKFMATSIGGK